MDTYRRTMAAFLALALVSVLNTAVRGQEVQAVFMNRVFWVSSDGPVAKALSDDDALRSSTALLLDHVTLAEEAILNETASRSPRDPDNPLRPCDANLKGWVNSVVQHHVVRGWPAPDTSCITDLHGVRSSAGEPRYTLDQVYDAVITRAEVLKERVKSITDGILGNWTDPDVIHNAPFIRLSQRCVVDAIGIVRVGEFWYVITSLTNAPVEQNLPDFGRQILAEYHRVDPDGNFEPLLMSLPIRPDNEGDEVVVRNDSTTYLASWTGNRVPSHFISTFPSQNPAVLDALDASDIDVQQAEDAMTPSGIAILVLPLLLNLVPISLLAQVSTCTMLVYLVMSDVLTVIPLGIKGVELISIGTSRTRSVVLRVTTALNGTRSDSSAGELFASECRAQGDVLVAGIVFVVLSITFLIVGVVAELAAKRYVVVRRKKRMLRLFESGSTSPRYSSERSSHSSQGSRSRRPRGSGADRLSEQGEDLIAETDRNV